jgi:hypothetical protein
VTHVESRALNSVIVDVDHVVEHAHGRGDGLFSLSWSRPSRR